MAVQYDATPRTGNDLSGLAISSVAGLGGTIGLRVVVDDAAVMTSKADVLRTLESIYNQVQMLSWPLVATFRREPNDANSFFLVTRMADGSGKVEKLQRGVGAAADAGNVGTQYLRFRPTAEGTLSAYDLPVAANVVWQRNEIGASDLVGRDASNKFFGSFHGDGANGILHSETITMDGVAVSHLTAGSGRSFQLRNDTTSSDGVTTLRADLQYDAIAGAGLRLTCNSASGTGIALAYFGMLIGTGTGFVEMFPAYGGVEVSGALLFQAAQEGVAYWQNASGVRMRNPTTGGYVSISGNLVGRTGFVEARTDKEVSNSRSKTYLGAFTDLTGLAGAVVTFDWGLTAPGASTPLNNVLSDTTFASPPWSRVQSNSTVVDSAGDVTMTWSSGTSNSREHISTGTGVGFQGFASVDLVSATGAGTREFYVGANSNGSNTSPAPAATSSTYQTLLPVGRTILAFTGNAAVGEQRHGVRAAATAAATAVFRNPGLFARA